MAILKSTPYFIFILIAHLSFGQNPKNKMSIELSIPHTREFAYINDCSSLKKASVIIHNNTDTTNYFYENWNTYGYYNISFEIKFEDSIHQIIRPRKLWYRNYPSYLIVNANESLVFDYALIDTSCAAKLVNERFFEHGWIGFPPISDTVEIRAVYQLCHLEDSIPGERIMRLNYRKEDYLDYLDGDIESKQIEPKTIIIFKEPLISEWQRVILH